ncbi:hypothetical protein CYMTET_39639 [Cymbomonas tetramitiformis]|uniref:Cation/H+ exchanger transmembrane domain-containing protein n=1 Tax=Cymbomonas tetramitiformis TaxID=36881 RepID=A0AAE0CAR1_9CHLO|nr:hypothetical protein CYMTET_39639 [Cymbomonas tetramitiformis]
MRGFGQWVQRFLQQLTPKTWMTTMSLAFTSGLFLLLVTEMQFKTHEAAMLVPADTPLQSEITLQEYTAVPEVAKAEAPFEAEWSEDEETQSPSEPQEQGEEGAFEDERNMPHTAGLYLFVMLLLGLCTKALLASRHFRDHQIPFTVAVLVLGVLIGVAYQILTDCDVHTCNGTVAESAPLLVNSVRMWVNIDPHLLLNLFLPALIFSDSFQLNIHMVKKCFTQCSLLACPGVFMGVVLTACFAKFVLPYEWGWVLCFLFGSTLSATDPVAVLSLLKDLGASKHLGMLVAGEALFNDGTAIVLFELFSDVLQGEETSMKAFVCKFAWMALGGGGLGFVFGVMGSLCLGYTENGVIETVITIIVAYLGFFIAENQAGVSGILATVAAGISMSALGRTSIRNPQTIHQVWDTIEFCGNTLIFMLAGNIFGVVLAEPNNGVGVYEWSYLSLLWIALLAIRAVVVLCFYPVLKFLGYGLHWKDAAVLVWSGLRGAVGLAMAIMADEADYTSPEEGKQIVFYAGGIAFLTVLLNGFTTRYLMAMLGMLDSSSAEETLLVYARQGLKNRTQDIYRTLCGDPLLSLHDPGAVQAVCIVLSDERTESQELPGGSGSAGMTGIRRKIREIYLGVVRSAYWGQIETGALPEGLPSVVLLQSVEAALDQCGNSQWDFPDWLDIRETMASKVSLVKFTFLFNSGIKRCSLLFPLS